MGNETPTEKWGFFYVQEIPAAGSSIRKLVWQPCMDNCITYTTLANLFSSGSISLQKKNLEYYKNSFIFVL